MASYTSNTHMRETIQSLLHQMTDLLDFTRTSEQEILNGLQHRMGTHLDASSLQIAREQINSIVQSQEAMNPPSLLPVQHPHHQASQTTSSSSRYGSAHQDMTGSNNGQYPFDLFQGTLSNEVDFPHPYLANFGQFNNTDSSEPILDLPQPLQTYFDRTSMPLSQVSTEDFSCILSKVFN